MATSNSASDIALALLLEIGGLAVMVAVAGISDGMANMMLLLMVGIAMLWLLTNTSKFQGFLSAVTNVEKKA